MTIFLPIIKRDLNILLLTIKFILNEKVPISHQIVVTVYLPLPDLCSGAVATSSCAASSYGE